MIRILIAERSPQILEVLATLLDGHPGFEIVGTATDGPEALEKTAELLPDLVLMDGRLPRLNGVEATRRIKGDLPNVSVLFFSESSDDVAAGMAAGAAGYLTKDCTTNELFEEIERLSSHGE